MGEKGLFRALHLIIRRRLELDGHSGAIEAMPRESFDPFRLGVVIYHGVTGLGPTAMSASKGT